MKNKFKKIIKSTTTSILKSKAFSTSASACFVSLYQPKEPKSLQKK